MRCSINWSRIKTIRPAARGTLLLVLVALSFYAFTFGRARLRDSRTFPAVTLSPSSQIWIAYDDGFAERIVRQYSDDASVLDVIKMAKMVPHKIFSSKSVEQLRLQNGQSISVQIKDDEVVDFKLEWMSAAQRISLGVPLHPDRMKRTDWEALPGIGKKLAQRIELDRHKNGEYVSIEGLERVQGISNALIERWKKYF